MCSTGFFTAGQLRGVDPLLSLLLSGREQIVRTAESQIVVPRPAAAAALAHLLDTSILRPHPRGAESEAGHGGRWAQQPFEQTLQVLLMPAQV